MGGFRRGRARAADCDRRGGELLRETRTNGSLERKEGFQPGRGVGGDVRRPRQRFRGEIVFPSVARRVGDDPRPTERRGYPPGESGGFAGQKKKPTSHTRGVPRRVANPERGSAACGARDLLFDVAAQPFLRSQRARRTRAGSPHADSARLRFGSRTVVPRARDHPRDAAVRFTRGTPRFVRARARFRAEQNAARASKRVARVRLRVRRVSSRKKRRRAFASREWRRRLGDHASMGRHHRRRARVVRVVRRPHVRARA
mmetsp:Transcript_3998/g.15929  ORF Transcript_3998/g.15929 Transcript_3998/m.15929 type:complete len:258 (-) Transcript_3998:608-1381(-)